MEKRDGDREIKREREIVGKRDGEKEEEREDKKGN